MTFKYASASTEIGSFLTRVMISLNNLFQKESIIIMVYVAFLACLNFWNTEWEEKRVWLIVSGEL